MTRKEELIKKRKSFLSADEARDVQNELKEIYINEYKPKHDAETYLQLIFEHNVGEIEEINSQSCNYPEYVYQCFSCLSQHVYGYTKHHCLDIIYEAAQRKKERIEYYKSLPTLQEIIESDLKINPDKKYDVKEKDTYEDSCDTFICSDLLEIRRTGLDEYYFKRFESLYEFYLGNDEDN